MTIAIALLVIAPALPTPPNGLPVPFGWEVLSRWDGEHYERIARLGYEFANDGRAYNVAFLPLFTIASLQSFENERYAQNLWVG